MPRDADQTLPSPLTHHAELEEIFPKKSTCCRLQILAAEEVLGNDFKVTGKRRQRGQTSTKELETALLELCKALAELERMQWEEPIFEPLQRSTTLEVGKVLQDFGQPCRRNGQVLRVFEVPRFPCGDRLGGRNPS
jgi:hypothetical protein